MTRLAIRDTLSALAAVVLVTAFASSPVSAKAWHCSNFRLELGGLPSKPKTPKGLATKKGSSMAKPHPSTGLTSPVGFDQGLLR